MSAESAVDVALRMTVKDDGATAALRTASQSAQKEAAKVASATERAAQKAADDVHKSASRQRSSYEKLSQARETLGMRSEHAIQREIQRTEAAYQRLAASGTLSAQQQARALEITKQKVTALTNEMGKLTDEQRKQEQLAQRQEAWSKRMRTGGIVAAGGAAAVYALKEPVKQAMSFDERLAGMANTAFRERDAKGRIAGMSELEGAITNAWRTGGGTREQAAEALDSVIASGAVNVTDAMAMLPSLMKASKASGASASELAQIGVTAMRSFKIDAADLPNVMNMAMAAGQAGGFELKDMAKWLPQQMAAASLSGLSGRDGFAKLAALNQVSRITAGTQDEAGNNVVNLLAKINSEDTAKDAKKLGVDLPAYLQKQRAKGVDSVDAFAALVNKTVTGRSDYQALQKQLAGAKNNDEKKAALESMATIAQGAGIGKLIQDRQALMALLGLMNNKAYMQDVLSQVKANDLRTGGEVDTAHEVMSSRPGYKAEQVAQEKLNAEQQGMNQLMPLVGALSDGFTTMAQRFPIMTSAVVATVPPLMAMASAAGLASIAMGGKGGGAIGRTAARVASSGVGQRVIRGAKVGGIAGVGAMVGDAALGAAFGEDSAITRYGSSALNGAALGATVGSIVPVVGTAIGAALGGAGGLAWEGLKDLLKPNDEEKKLNAEVHVSVSDDRTTVTRTKLDASGVNAQMDTGNIVTGAP